VAPPAKSLREHVRDGSFRPSRHAHLLDGEDLPETTAKQLRDLQRIYRYLHWSPRVRAALAVEFAETIVRARDPLWLLGQLAASKHLTPGPAVRRPRR
jgi:hypothetical protein